MIAQRLGRLVDYNDPCSLGSRFRRRRVRVLLRLIDNVFRKRGAVNVLDVGGTRGYWDIADPALLASRNVTITVLNLPGEVRGRDDKTFRFAEGDGCDLSRYENNSFDIVHSNSVIEHLGGPGLRLAFAAEVRRLAPSYFVQTPNFWFPVEPHFMFPVIHWLPEGLRADLLARMPLGIYRRAESRGDALRAVRAICLLTRRQMAELFPDGRILTERLALLPKSLVAVRGPL